MPLSTTDKNRFEEIKSKLEVEKIKTEKIRSEVLNFLSHNTSITRKQFATALRQQAEYVENERVIDKDLE